MEKIIEKIVNNTHSKYGKTTLFREVEYTEVTVDKTTAFYRVQSAINYPYIYEIQLKVFDKVLYKPPLIRSKKCMYCDKKGATYKFKCCNQYIHFDCGIRNKFSCCHLDSYLCSDQKGECCVCMEDTNTITECGHHLCVNCLANMYKHDKNYEVNLLCPYCRANILEERKGLDYVNVNVGDSDEVVCLSFL